MFPNTLRVFLEIINLLFAWWQNRSRTSEEYCALIQSFRNATFHIMVGWRGKGAVLTRGLGLSYTGLGTTFWEQTLLLARNPDNDLWRRTADAIDFHLISYLRLWIDQCLGAGLEQSARQEISPYDPTKPQ
jgi:hypothetical protein